MKIYTDLEGLQKIIRIGARGSALAQAQAALVCTEVQRRVPGITTELKAIRTHGDLDQTSPLSVIGGQGVFTSALQHALLAGEIDLAVHSAKDLPSTPTPGLTLVFPLAREDVRDALVSAHGRGLAELPPSPRIGTSSRRRAAQLRVLRPDAVIAEIRGNVDTRLRKAESGEFDAIVLAAAGLHRMGWQHRITAYLPVEQMMPAPGQGVLAVEIRAANEQLLSLLRALEDPAVALAVRVERAFLRAIGAGCTQPVAAYADMRDGELQFQAMLANDEGDQIERTAARLDPTAAEEQAADLARQLLRAIARRAIPATGALAGWSVLVTRPAEQAARLIETLRVAGAEPVAQATIRIAPPSDSAALERAISQLVAGDYAWVVFASVNGVEAVVERLTGQIPAATRVAAVGPSTAARLIAAGIAVQLVPEQHDGDGLLHALLERGVTGQRILLPRADIGGERLPIGLRHAGAIVDDVAAYRTVPMESLEPDIHERLRRCEIDAVTFTSGSSVRGLLTQLGDKRHLLDGIAVVCIGQPTADAARASGLSVAAIAAQPSVDGLVAAVVSARRERAQPAAGSERTS